VSVQRGGHEDDLEIGSLDQQTTQHNQQEVRLHAALVYLKTSNHLCVIAGFSRAFLNKNLYSVKVWKKISLCSI